MVLHRPIETTSLAGHVDAQSAREDGERSGSLSRLNSDVLHDLDAIITSMTGEVKKSEAA